MALSSTQLILVLGLNRAWGVGDQLFAIADSVALTVLGQVISFLSTSSRYENPLIVLLASKLARYSRVKVWTVCRWHSCLL